MDEQEQQNNDQIPDQEQPLIPPQLHVLPLQLDGRPFESNQSASSQLGSMQLNSNRMSSSYENLFELNQPQPNPFQPDLLHSNHPSLNSFQPDLLQSDQPLPNPQPDQLQSNRPPLTPPQPDQMQSDQRSQNPFPRNLIPFSDSYIYQQQLRWEQLNQYILELEPLQHNVAELLRRTLSRSVRQEVNLFRLEIQNVRLRTELEKSHIAMIFLQHTIDNM